MKKLYFLLMLISIIFISSIDVNALTTNKGKLYEVYWSESKVNVFAEDTTTKGMDYNGWYIESSSDDNIYYCIEPESYMLGKSEAVTGTHTVLSTDSDISSHLRISNSKYKRVKLLAYYGYKYGDHKEKYWYGITQKMIWDEIRPDITWQYKTSRYGTVNKSLYTKEEKELTALVDNHHALPSFNNKQLKISLKDGDYTLTDTNKVLENFTIENNECADFKINGSELLIHPKTACGISDITLKRKKTLEKVKLYYSSTYQDIISRGEIESNDGAFKLEITGIPVEVYKYDSTTNTYVHNDYRSLFNTMYEVYEDNDLKAQITFGGTPATLNCSYGKQYKFVEVQAGKGYKINQEDLIIDFDENSPTTYILYDEPMTGTLKIKKYKIDYNNDKSFEYLAKFNIYDMDNVLVGTLTTDKNGEGSISLPYGKYTLQQIEGEKGYVYSDDLTFIIDEEKDYYYELNNYIKTKIVLKKIDNDTQKSLENVCFNLYDSDQRFLKNSCTNKNGIIEFTDLDIGRYIIKEITALPYYLNVFSPIVVEVNENGQIINLTVTNEKEKLPLRIIKVDTDTKQPLANVKFGIYDYNTDKLVIEATTDEFGTIYFEEFPAGKYYILELSTLDDYVIDKNKHEFELTTQGIVIELTNEKKTVPLKIIKVDLDTKKPLENVKFGIYDYNTDILIEEVFTNKFGIIYLDNLKVGKYYLLELSTNEDYVLDTTKHIFELKDQEVIIELTNKKITNPKTLDNILGYFILAGISLFSIFSIIVTNHKKR